VFQPRDQVDLDQGGASGEPALLPLDHALPFNLRDRLFALWHALHRADWVPDLAEDVGSRKWIKGLALFAGLLALTLSFWPSLELRAAPTLRDDAAVRDEYRSQMIMPLAQGGDSGRHMAALTAVVPVSEAAERPRVALTAFVSAGDGFARMLQRAGVSADDAGHAADLVGNKVPLGQIAPGTRVEVTLGARPAPGAARMLESVSLRARIDLDLTVRRRGAELALATRTLAVDDTPLRIRGIVGESLYRSARSAGVPAGALQQYLQALNANMDLDAVQPGDSFDVVVAFKRSTGGEVQSGNLLYAGLARGAQPVAELVRWGTAGQFYSAEALGKPVVETITSGGGGMLMPVNGRITSPFGMRFHPILGYTRMHSGVDIAAPWGTPVRATSDGVVSFAGRHGGHGNYVRLEMGGGIGTGYGHLSRIAVAYGQRVRAGEIIGYVGSTGLSTGPHLHYEMYRGGRTVNPLGARYETFTTTTVARIDPKELAAFKAKLAQYKAIRPGATLSQTAMTRSSVIALR